MNSSSSKEQWQQEAINPSAQAVEHLVKLAQSPGWWEYVKARARELDRDESRLFVDIEQQVARRLQAMGWRPPRASGCRPAIRAR